MHLQSRHSSLPQPHSRALRAEPRDDGDVVAGELVLGQQFADFHLDQLEELGVVDHVDLVQEDDDVGHADLAGEQDVLAGLGHGAVGGGHDQDGAVHLGRAGDHVLDVVGVARAVDVRVVALVGLVLDVGGGDGDAALALFGSVVDLVERPDSRCWGYASARQHGDGGGQVVLPWSTWPMVPTLTCGLVRSNFCFAMFPPFLLETRSGGPRRPTVMHCSYSDSVPSCSRLRAAPDRLRALCRATSLPQWRSGPRRSD